MSSGRDFSPPVSITMHDSESRPKVFLVCGMTGAGKSTFINVLTGANLPVGHGVDSETTEVEERRIPLVKISQGYIRLVDTPGFDDSRDDSETAVLTRITEWLANSYRTGARITGLIFLRPIHTVRVCRSEAILMKMFKQLCGEDSLDHVVLITTRWHLPPEPEEEAREVALATNSRCFGTAGTQKVQIRHLENTYSKEDVMRIFESLAQLSPVTLQVQREIVRDGKSFKETSAGAQVGAQLEDEIEQLRARLRQQQKTHAEVQARFVEIQRTQIHRVESPGCVCA